VYDEPGGIEKDLFGTFLDLKGYPDGSLIGPVTQKLQVMDRKVIIDRLNSEKQSASALIFGAVAYVSGRTSRSEAMLRDCWLRQLQKRRNGIATRAGRVNRGDRDGLKRVPAVPVKRAKGFD
jgi:hypothetical protein